MKGIILAGGLGTRLFPSTKVINKHLLPVYDKPMILYPIQTLIQSGVADILIISSKEHLSAFIELLGSGSEFNANFTYKIQEGTSGVGDALKCASDFAKNEPVALILGDNIFTENFKKTIENFKNDGAIIFLKEVEEPQRFGIAEIQGKKIISIKEKPLYPKSNLAVTGFYIYDSRAFELLEKLKPSERGEIEITDLNNLYIKEGKLHAEFVTDDWIDAGTHDSLLQASIMIQKHLSQDDQFSAVKIKTPKKVVAGVLIYENKEKEASKYFDACFASLLKQDYPALEIYVLDNGSPIKSGIQKLKERFREIKFLESQKNLGFGAGHNFILRNTESEFYACLNYDILFEPDFISKLIAGIQKSPDIGTTTGKIKRWDFERFEKARIEGNFYEDGKTNFIDSVGIRICKNHRFENRGEGEVDYGQHDKTEEIFGASAAAVMYKRNALESIAFVNDCGEKEYFDELFFMYKEDIDISYRLQWMGWKTYLIPDAVAYHDRNVISTGNDIFSIIKNRGQKPEKVNEWSFLNQEILLAKHFRHRKFSGNVKKKTRWYKLKSLLYILLFEPRLLKQYKKLAEISEQIEKRVLRMPKTVSEKEIEKLME